jgi:hypothetical protein
MHMPLVFVLTCLVVIGINLLYGRHRAAALVTSGRITQKELATFVWSTFALLGGAVVAFWAVWELSHVADMTCLMIFPRRPASIAMWLIQATLSGTIVYWLWFRNGADVLARLAPAFTRGAVVGRAYSASRVKFAVSVLVVVAPMLNIAIQLAQPVLTSACENI